MLETQQVVIFTANEANFLENKVNKFLLERKYSQIIDIKYSICETKSILSNHQYTAMIHYTTK